MPARSVRPAWTNCAGKPVRPGDSLRVKAEVKSKRASKTKPDRGVLHMDYWVMNQHDEAVMTYTAIHIFKRKSG